MNQPQDMTELLDIAFTAFQQGNYEQAKSLLQTAVAQKTKHPMVYNLLGLLAHLEHCLSDAEDHFIRAIELGLPDSAAVCNLATVLLKTGRADEAVALMQPSAEALPLSVGVQEKMAMLSNYRDDITPEQSLDQHRKFGQALRATLGQPNQYSLLDRAMKKKLRVGIVSPDMRRHSVAAFLLPLVENMDRSRVELVLYSAAGKPDTITEQFKATADLWREVGRLGNDQLEKIIQQDQIDIMIETAGLFEGHHLYLMAKRVAPVQVTYLGYPNTTGIDVMDYRIVDPITDPPAKQSLVCEKRSYVEPCLWCYRPLTNVSPSPYLPKSPGDSVVFGCFNALSKYTPSLLSMWARIMEEVEGAKLLIKAGPLGESRCEEILLDSLANAGVDIERVILLGHTESQADHMRVYERVDIALDTWPYHGTTTTCEALSMGIPVVTRLGNSHVSRVGGSILEAVGLGELVALSEQEYIQTAIDLAGDLTRLTNYHQTLASQFKQSPMCDEAQVANQMVDVLFAVWKNWAMPFSP